MAKHQNLSAYQQKIVKRYYEHADSITIQKLQELVSELYLAEGKSADKLWKRAEELLTKAQAEPAKVHKLVTSRDPKAFAEIVAKLAKPG
ncbi:MAG: hypothetical protein ACREJO_17040 [Phycisphaerales bacterium]